MRNQKERILVVVDDIHNGSWINKIQQFPSAEVTLLTLGVHPDSFLKKWGHLIRGLPVKVFPVSEFYEEAQRRVQEYYPQFIYELPRKLKIRNSSLLELLRDGGVNYWWLLDISEKSALRGNLINHIYYLELFDLAWKGSMPHHIFFDLTSYALSDAILSYKLPKHIGRNRWLANGRAGMKVGYLKFFLELFVRRFVLFSRLALQSLAVRIFLKPISFERDTTCFVSSYPHLWMNPFSQKPIDRMYGILPEKLSSRSPVGYLMWIYVSGYEVWKKRKEFNHLLEKKKIYPLISAASVFSLFRIFGRASLIRPLTILAGVGKIKEVFYKGFNIATIVQNELVRAFVQSEYPLDVIRLYCYRRIFQRRNIRLVIHWGEFQAYEKSIGFAAKDSHIPTIAFQHSAASPMFLNYHFIEEEFKISRDLNEVDRMPIPNFYITTGRYLPEVLMKSGFSSDAVRVCGAVRYPWLMQAMQNGVRAYPKKGNAILVIAGIHRDENLRLAYSLGEAFERDELWNGYEVFIKCHPLLRIEDEFEWSIKNQNPNIKITTFGPDVHLSDVLLKSVVAICNSSASGLEAIAMGVMPIFFCNLHRYDVNVLYSLRDAILFASNSSELTKGMRVVLANDSSINEMKKSWERKLLYLFDKIDTHAEDRFLESLHHFKI